MRPLGTHATAVNAWSLTARAKSGIGAQNVSTAVSSTGFPMRQHPTLQFEGTIVRH